MRAGAPAKPSRRQQLHPEGHPRDPVASWLGGIHSGASVSAAESAPMSTEAKHYTGGCLCGALRYEAFGESIGSGHCYCADCRRASGSGFVPFMGFEAEFGSLHRRSAPVPFESGKRRRRRAKPMRHMHESGVRRRNRKVRLLHALRRLARRSVSLPPDPRHLRSRSSTLGDHPARPQGLRSDAADDGGPEIGSRADKSSLLAQLRERNRTVSCRLGVEAQPAKWSAAPGTTRRSDIKRLREIVQILLRRPGHAEI